MEAATRTHDYTRYQGKNLLCLLLALIVPAGLLYLRVLFAMAASAKQVTENEYVWLLRLSEAALVLFFCAQAVAARYVQRLFAPARTKLRAALQYAGVALLGLLFSMIGAVLLEAFGYELFLRIAGTRP